MNLSYLRDNAFERVKNTMRLRRPQREAFERFHDIFKTLPKKLSSCTHREVTKLFREVFPGWHYEGPCPEITLYLATGVGKTRLIGALMAYLYLAQESEHFLIVTPRSEIIRKFLRECRPSDPKYIFFDRNLVEEPEVIDAETATYFEPGQQRLYSGPVIWILTPQALAVPGSKLKRKTDHTLLSPVEYLKSLPDLAIFFDESHHLGQREAEDSSVWRREIRALEAKFMFGTTGSVGDGETHNILYSYDTKKCLNEHLYTKMVRVIAEKKDGAMSDDDHDRMVLRYGLKRLGIKQAALDDHAKTEGLTRVLKAVMLVFCKTQDHAEEVVAFLRDTPELRDSVLLVHSRLGPSKYLEDLLSLEQEGNDKRVVVNVSILTEGWDVSNVYVIVPLRAMASSILVTQVMGRGLRLPFGEQVGSVEVDTLDVLCFGRETMQEICDQILKQGFGLKDSGVSVEPAPKDKRDPNDKYVPSKAFTLTRKLPVMEIRIPHIRMRRDPLDLDNVSIPGLSSSEVRAFKIHDPQTIETLKGRPGFTRLAFLGMVSTGILKRCRYLSAQKHDIPARDLVERFLSASGYTGSEVSLEPEIVVYHLKDHLDTLNRGVAPVYVPDKGEDIISLEGIVISVPGHFTSPVDSATVNFRSWEKEVHKGIPMRGWRRCVFEAVPFDTQNELSVAKAIDRSPEIHWWFRNLPKIINLATPAGQYAPDFAVLVQTDEETILLEVKGEVFAVGEEAEANIKKEAARRWCQAMSHASGEKWTYWFLMDKDASRCANLADIRRYVKDPEEQTV
jgi:superfamily II DNA or RNA helicase